MISRSCWTMVCPPPWSAGFALSACTCFGSCARVGLSLAHPLFASIGQPVWLWHEMIHHPEWLMCRGWMGL